MVALVAGAVLLGAVPAAAGSPPPYLGEVSTDVTMPGVVRSSNGVAVAPDGTVYVADSGNHRVQRFAADGSVLTAWGGFGTGNGKFDDPLGVAVDAAGDVYVTDRGNNRVQKFSATGAFLAKWGSAGSGNGQFDAPHGIAVDADGVVYVTDPGNFRVQRFTSAGAFLGSWAQTNAAWGIAAAPDGSVYVTVLQVGGSPLVQKRSATGTFLAGWTVNGTFNSTLRLMIAVGATGDVYVTHPVSRVVRYTSTGDFVASLGTPFDPPSGVGVTAGGTAVVADEGGFVREYEMTGTVVRQFGSAGFGQTPGGSRPVAVDFDAAGNRFVADFGLHRILKFDAAGTLVAEWGTLGTGNGQFNLPVGVAVDAAGNVYVADTNNHRIQKFDNAGNFLLKWGTAGSAPGQLLVPGGVDVDALGNVYVADSANARVQKFNGNGGFLLQWGSNGAGQGQFTFPTDVAVDPAGNVYVADRDAGRVQRFTSGGGFLSAWNAAGEDLAVNSTGDVFVADGDQPRIRRFTSAGVLVTQWGSAGTAPGQFQDFSPIGVTVGPQDHVFVADYGNARIQEFGAEGVALRPDAIIRKGATGTNKGNDIYNTTGAQQASSATVTRGSAIIYFVTLQNDSTVPDRLRVKVNRPGPYFQVKVKIGTQDITLAATGLTSPFFLTDVVAPGDQVVVKVKVKVLSGPPPNTFTGKLTVRSDADPTVRDVVKYTTRRR
ncbi:MAG: SMP-30/gluconolactonase/LRE family protein [Microthrixaceae bacterium]|nr:SMP-30/gluconolactonase/LRE family protein [Microthrixaceae bacterium]